MHAHHCHGRFEQEGGALGPQHLELGAFTEASSSQGGVVKSFSYKNHERVYLVEEFVESLRPNITSIVKQCLDFFHSLKLQFTIHVYLVHDKNNEIIKPSFNSPFTTITHENFIESAIVHAVEFIVGSLNVLNERNSGWSILRIDTLDITIAKNSPLRGGSGPIKRPKALKGKLGLLDFKNCPEKQCFVYAFLGSLHYNDVELSKRRRWVEYNAFKKNYNFGCLQFPVKPSELARFEELNKVSVCIFCAEGTDIYPLRVCHNRYPKIASLLYIQDKKSAHYIGVHDFNALVGEDGVHRHFYCLYCFSKFRGQRLCNDHMNKCMEYEAQVITFPKPLPDGSLGCKEFRNYFKTFKIPYVLIADLETTLEPLPQPEAAVLRGMGKGTCYRKKLDTMAYGVVLLGPEGYYEYHDYTGPDAMAKFLKKCLDLANFALGMLKFDHGFPTLTPEQQQRHEQATHCPLCKKRFGDDGVIKVIHHLHHLSTDSYAGTICSKCNLQLKNRPFVPCLLHSGASLDFREIVKGLDNEIIKHIDIVPKSSEKFTAITINKILRFVDSYSFLSSSLSSLIDLTKKGGLQNFKYLCKEFNNFSGDINLIVEKQINCYDFYTDLSCLEQKSLPPREAFYNSLREQDITPDEYLHAQRMWQLLGCRTMDDWLKFYLKVDVFALLDIVVTFRDRAYDKYGLDFLNYYTGSSFYFDNLLKQTNSKFENINDIDLFRVLNRANLGGICHVNKRYIEANLPGHDDFDPTKPASQILYLDFTALYARAMLEPLYAEGFTKLTKEELERLSANKYETLRNFKTDSESMFLIFDAWIPKKFHDALRYLPPAPQKMKVSKSLLSQHQLKFIDDNSSETTGSMNSERLLLTLLPKKDYVCYLPLLQYYIKIGLRISKLKGGYKFKVSQQIAPFINLCCNERKDATDVVIKNLIKLQTNSCFGFSCRRKDLDVNVIIVRNAAECAYYIAHPRFKGLVEIKPNVTAIFLKPHKVCIDLPYALGTCVLSISKLFLYRLIYTELTPLFRFRTFIPSYFDTDSVCMYVTLLPGEKNIYKQLKKISHIIDFTTFGTQDGIYDETNRMRPGTLKNEYPQADIKAAVFLNCKCYIVSPYEGKGSPTVRCKGVARYLQSRLTFAHYYNCLMNQTVNRVNMNLLKSRSHQVYLVTMNKISLSALNTKIFYTDPHGVTGLPYGHWRIQRFLQGLPN